ncbi:MAG: glycosyltransferase family 39 protein [Actinomycetota bacterium]
MRFRPALAIVALGALVVRVGYILATNGDFVADGDARFYHEGANLLSDGHGFISPFVADRTVEAAEHPPLYVVFLAIPSAVGLETVLAHRLWSCLVGVVTVAVTGLLGRRVAGDRAGLIAAALAALYPNVWSPDTMLQAETLATAATIGAVLLAYRYLDEPRLQHLALAGAACGAGALARSELLLLVPFLLVPVALAARAVSWRSRVQWLGAAVLVPIVMIAPWSIYNATRFEHPILLSSQIYPLLASANCDSTYDGELQGYFDINCAVAVAAREGLTRADDQSEQGIVYRRAAFEYVGDHLQQLPKVVGIRLLRILGLYEPERFIRMDDFVEGRDAWVARAALYSFYAVSILAIAGAIILRRRRPVPLFPLVAPIAMVLVTVVVTYASTRFRAATEPALIVLAAVTIDALATKVRRYSRKI